MPDYHRVVGIDLGTTFSVIAAYNTVKGDVVVIPNQQNHRTTPSVVYVSPEGQTSVGEAARQQLRRDPRGVIIEAKRAMGERDAGDRKKELYGNNIALAPEVVSSLILKELKAFAEKYIGAPIYDAVITVPAYFKEPQKNATRESARIAGINPRLILNEPTAAAVAYGLEREENAVFIIYDFGGGTFDVSIVRVETGAANGIEVLGTGGDAHLGGGDIDQGIVNWALGRMKTQFERDFSGEQKLVGRLRLESERVKIDLCNQPDRSSQELFLEVPAPGIDEISYELTRSELNRIVAPIVDRTRQEVEVALESARTRHQITMEDVEAFILVGGSSRMPQVERMLKETFGKPVKGDLNPNEIVAIGAARLAAQYAPSEGPQLDEDQPIVIAPMAEVPAGLGAPPDLKDVVSHTLGIGLKDDVYDALIPKDEFIPTKVVRGGYTTAEDNQPSIWVPVYQGDNPVGSKNHKLGEVIIDGLIPEPKGTHRFEVTFALDADGIFFGEIRHEQTGAKRPIKLQRPDGLTDKRRLADMVAAGCVMPAQPGAHPAAGDPVAELMQRAREAAPNLPAHLQVELRGLMQQLERAVANNAESTVTAFCLAISDILNRKAW